MSRRDKYHYVVKDALIREGWAITHDPYVFKTDPKLSTDLGAERLIAAERGVEKNRGGNQKFSACVSSRRFGGRRWTV